MSDSVASFARRIQSRKQIYNLSMELLKRKEELLDRLKKLNGRAFLFQGQKKQKQIIAETGSERLDRWIKT